jgi:hypothetical protein
MRLIGYQSHYSQGSGSSSCDWCRRAVQISPPNTFPPGAAVAMYNQGANQIDVLAVDNNGALAISWVASQVGAAWSGPAQISPPNTFPPTNPGI